MAVSGCGSIYRDETYCVKLLTNITDSLSISCINVAALNIDVYV